MKYFAIYDEKIQCYQNPVPFRTQGEALRTFMDTVNDHSSEHYLNKHPEDYILFEVGEYDEKAGVFKPYEHPISVATALSVKQ